MNKKIISMFLAGSILTTSSIQTMSISYANNLENIEEYTQEQSKNQFENYKNEDVYETFKKPMPKTILEPNMTDHELSDTENLSNINYFKLKTDSDYEVALSHGDEIYTYLEETDSLAKAIAIADDNKSLYRSNTIPVVISKDGVVVYATEGIAKIVKMKNGQPISQSSYIATLYKDSQGKKEHSYIVHSSIDDVPVIEANDTMVKIEVSGFNGWIKRSDDNGENLIMVPINDAKNLSFYQVNSKNQLVHSISTAVETVGKSESIVIGTPPSFMQPLKKYYSYDGIYFYDDINKLISDLRASNHNSSVNNNNPYYNYYNYLPGRSKTVYTASELNKYIDKYASKDSVLRNTGESFIKHQDKYGVNALMALAISINESGFGSKLVKPNNIFGIKANDGQESGASSFASVDECIEVFMNDYISTKYYSVRWSQYNGSSLGNKNIGVNVKYASDPYWGEKAASHMYKIDLELSGGNLREYNNEKLGIYTKQDKVVSKDNQLVHEVLNERTFASGANTAQIGDVVVITNESSDKYEISPDRAKVLRLGTHDWNFKGYINKNSVKLINNTKTGPKVNTLGGDNRYQTAINVSNRGWTTSSDNIVLVNSESIADALSATPFAYSKNAPILLTQKDKLHSDTEKEITRLKAKNIYIIGGSSVVSEQVVSKLNSMGLKVERIYGSDRYKTSLEIAKRLNNVSQVAVVNGLTGLPDAVSIAPVAARQNMPIILSSPNKGISIFDDYIKNNNIKNSYIIGGSSVVSDSIANKLPSSKRFGGNNRNETNAKIVENFYKNTTLNNIFVAKDGMKGSDQLIDALAVGVLAAKEDSPLIIVRNNLNYDQRKVLASKNAKEITQVGNGGNETAFNELLNMYKK